MPTVCVQLQTASERILTDCAPTVCVQLQTGSYCIYYILTGLCLPSGVRCISRFYQWRYIRSSMRRQAQSSGSSCRSDRWIGRPRCQAGIESLPHSYLSAPASEHLHRLTAPSGRLAACSGSLPSPVAEQASAAAQGVRPCSSFTSPRTQTLSRGTRDCWFIVEACPYLYGGHCRVYSAENVCYLKANLSCRDSAAPIRAPWPVGSAIRCVMVEAISQGVAWIAIVGITRHCYLTIRHVRAIYDSNKKPHVNRGSSDGLCSAT